MQSPRISRGGVLAKRRLLVNDGGLPEAKRLCHLMNGVPFYEPTGDETFE
jgi:hypothetical protein